MVIYDCDSWTLTMADTKELRTFERNCVQSLGQYKRWKWLLDIWNELWPWWFYQVNWYSMVYKEQRTGTCSADGWWKNYKDNNAVEGYWKETRGRPWKQRTKDVEQDVRTMGIREWKRTASEQVEWRGIVDQAKNHIGLWCHRKKKMWSPITVFVLTRYFSWNTITFVCYQICLSYILFPLSLKNKLMTFVNYSQNIDCL